MSASCSICGSCTCADCIAHDGRCVKDGAKIAAAALLMRGVLRPIHDYYASGGLYPKPGPRHQSEIQAAMKAYDDAVREGE